MPQIPSFIPRRSLGIAEKSFKKSSPIGLLSIVEGGIIGLALLFSVGAFALRAFQERQIDALHDRLNVLFDELDPATVRAIDTFNKKLALAVNLLDEHTYTSRIFTFLSQTTLKDVRFSSFSFSAKERTVVLATEAKGYNALIKQLNLFRKNSSVETVEMGSVSLGPTGAALTTITLKVASPLLHL